MSISINKNWYVNNSLDFLKYFYVKTVTPIWYVQVLSDQNFDWKAYFKNYFSCIFLIPYVPSRKA